MSKEVKKKGKQDRKWAQRNWSCTHSAKKAKTSSIYLSTILLTVSQFKSLFLKLKKYFLKCFKSITVILSFLTDKPWKSRT